MQKNLYLYSGVIVKINSHLPTRHQKYNKPMLQLLTAVTLSFLLPHVNAAEVTKSAILATGIEYDSNPSLADTNKDSAWIFTLAPQIKLDIKDEINLWFLDATLLINRYSNQKVLVNREDPKLTVGWDRTYESGIFGVKADYQETSARFAELQSTGVFSSVDNTQKNKKLAAKWQHAINSRWGILTDGAYYDVSFSVPGTLDNYSLGEVRSQLSYANSEKLGTFAEIGYSQLRPDRDFDNTDMARLMAGANYQISEGLSISSRAGIYNLSGRQSDTDWIAQVKADKATDRANYSVGISRDLVASGVGGFRKADSLKVAWQFNASDSDLIGAEFQLDKYKKDTSVNVDRLTFQQLIAYYDRILTSHWKVRLSAAQKEIDTPDSNARANVIGVTLVYDTLSF